MPGTPGALAGRIALVTGASRGIGRAVARRFAAEGAQVVAVARTEGALTELDDEVRAAGHGRLSLVPADVADPAIPGRVAQAVAQRFGRLDVLVGNAAILGTLSPVGHIDPAEWDRVFATNVTANRNLIRAFDPLLRVSGTGRAIFVTSGVTQGRFPYWSAYAASKAALEALVQCYAAEVERLGVKANLLDPGVVRTGMRAQAMPGEDPQTLPPPEAVCDGFVLLARADCPCNGERYRVAAVV